MDVDELQLLPSSSSHPRISFQTLNVSRSFTSQSVARPQPEAEPQAQVQSSDTESVLSVIERMQKEHASDKATWQREIDECRRDAELRIRDIKEAHLDILAERDEKEKGLEAEVAKHRSQLERSEMRLDNLLQKYLALATSVVQHPPGNVSVNSTATASSPTVVPSFVDPMQTPARKPGTSTAHQPSSSPETEMIPRQSARIPLLVSPFVSANDTSGSPSVHPTSATTTDGDAGNSTNIWADLQIAPNPSYHQSPRPDPKSLTESEVAKQILPSGSGPAPPSLQVDPTANADANTDADADAEGDADDPVTGDADDDAAAAPAAGATANGRLNGEVEIATAGIEADGKEGASTTPGALFGHSVIA